MTNFELSTQVGLIKILISQPCLCLVGRLMAIEPGYLQALGQGRDQKFTYIRFFHESQRLCRHSDLMGLMAQSLKLLGALNWNPIVPLPRISMSITKQRNYLRTNPSSLVLCDKINK